VKQQLASTFNTILPARRFDSAVYAVALCSSVRPSVRHKSLFYLNSWS